MARSILTGSRIRERRLIAGLRQTDLARSVGISPSYLNLIEHNRRGIGGKLLVDISAALEVEPAALTDDTEAALIAALREAAADLGEHKPEIDRADEFAGRFPGWAAALIAAYRQTLSLNTTVAALTDRLAHDPHLAASLHEVLSTATAIRSTAAILADNRELQPEWRFRFHRNLDEDSRRLADSAKALVGYLDDSDRSSDPRAAPQEEVEAFLAAQDYHFDALETGAMTPEQLVDGSEGLTSDAARAIARGALREYAADAAALPRDRMRAALEETGLDPAALARRLDAPPQLLLRRLAALPEQMLGQTVGLVICDASGSLLFRKPVAGFSMPRFGETCPLWPVFLALSRPHVPLRRRVVQIGRDRVFFECLAVAYPRLPGGFDEDPQYRAAMLIVPAASPDGPAAEVGSTCRVCPREGCAARREPSLLDASF